MSQRQAWIFVLFSALAAPGCLLRDSQPVFAPDLAHYQHLATTTAFPDAGAMAAEMLSESAPPRTIRDPAEATSWWNLSLEEAIQIAVSRSTVMRDLGANVRAFESGSTRTIHEPSIVSSDPTSGMEAALSDFDAALVTSVFVDSNDRMLNNFFTAGGARIFQQDLGTFQTELAKRSAAGTLTTLRSSLVYDANNAAGNLFPQSWDSIIEAEVRQPLLQGGGVQFNSIQGPERLDFDGRRRGNNLYQGVMVARLNTDVSLVDFRIALRNLVSNVENAYWDLYFAYRDLDAKVEVRNGSLEAWRTVQAMAEAKQPGGVAEREAQFREQYYRCEEDVREALTGRLLDRTNTFNGSSGGTFRGTSGVHVAERRLRMILGLEINDGRLLRPSEDPILSPITYDWRELLAESVTRREELHRQRLHVRRRELELVASRNFLLPRLDLVGRYRYRGLGESLFNGTSIAATDPPDFGNSSLGNLFGGHYQEWQLGGELGFPVGFRRAHAAVRNAQLQLARERSVLQEQERTVVHDLSDAVADVYRAYGSCQTNYNCRLAAKKQVDILRDKLTKRLPLNLDQLVDAERRFADADVQFQRASVEYMLALKNVHFEKGTLLEYSQVHLAESQEGSAPYSEVGHRDKSADPTLLNYVLNKPSPAGSAEAATSAAGQLPEASAGEPALEAGQVPPPMSWPPNLPLTTEPTTTPEPTDGASGPAARGPERPFAPGDPALDAAAMAVTTAAYLTDVAGPDAKAGKPRSRPDARESQDSAPGPTANGGPPVPRSRWPAESNRQSPWGPQPSESRRLPNTDEGSAGPLP